VAELLHKHFGGDRHRNIAGTGGLSVIYRSDSVPDSATPLPIDWSESEMTAVVVLVDTTLDSDLMWRDYVKGLSRETQARGLLTRLFPVRMEHEDMELQFEEQALRWDSWEERNGEREQRLIRDLTHEFCRMLRQRLSDETSLQSYLKKIQAFISHSKHDEDGECVAQGIRDWIHEHSQMSGFFDVYDIPPGVSFKEVLNRQIGGSAVMALHTDSYSSREWCRREVIEAKRQHVPMVVVDCLRDVDQRAIPYMGNVPIIRMNPDEPGGRTGAVVGRLLDEVFLDYLWRCRVRRYGEAHSDVSFMSRPPELISLAMLLGGQGGSGKIVHPEPLMAAEEIGLLREIAPNATIQTLMEWLEELR